MNGHWRLISRGRREAQGTRGARESFNSQELDHRGGLEADVLELSEPGRITGKLKSSRITVSGSLHVEKSIEGGRVEASRSLSIAETIKVENPSVSSLLTMVQKI